MEETARPLLRTGALGALLIICAGLMLLRAAKARALMAGRDHALPDDVQELAAVVLTHRIVLAPESAGDSPDDVRRHVVADALDTTRAL